MDQWYATDEGNVIYEEIEAELVVINLKTGYCQMLWMGGTLRSES